VEFVLVLTPLLLVLFGIVQFGMIMYQKTTVIHDAREAVRLAAVDDPAGKTLPSDAPSGSTLTFTCTTNPSSGNTPGAFNVGDTITAHVTYQYPVTIPIISSIIGSTVNLSSNASMSLDAQPVGYC
jgi:Flp pilus assembly protein TadG